MCNNGTEIHVLIKIKITTNYLQYLQVTGRGYKENKIKNNNQLFTIHIQANERAGADPGFQVRGAYLKKLRRAEGGAKIFGVFRAKNHDFTPKNHIFYIFRGARAGCVPPPLDPRLERLQRTKILEDKHQY